MVCLRLPKTLGMEKAYPPENVGAIFDYVSSIPPRQKLLTLRIVLAADQILNADMRQNLRLFVKSIVQSKA